MKKIFTLLFLVIVLSFYGCSSNQQNYEKNKVYEIYSQDGSSLAQHKSEIVFESNSSEKNKLIKTKTIEVNGVKYEVSYKNTQDFYWYNGEIDHYEGTNENGYPVQVGINTKNDLVVRYSCFEKQEVIASPTLEKSRDECLEIAKEYLSKYVSDVENYKLKSENCNERKNYVSNYTFSFYRYIGELKAYDLAIILITSHGDVFMHRFDCLGELKNAKVPDQATLDELDIKVTEKLDEIYSSVKDTYAVEYGERDVSLIRLSDGSYALEYYVDVEILENGDLGYSESTHLIIYLD